MKQVKRIALLPSGNSYRGDRSRPYAVVEAVVTASIAAAAGQLCKVFTVGLIRDNRQDRIELSMAKDYVSRSEYAADQSKLEEHMIASRTSWIFISNFLQEVIN